MTLKPWKVGTSPTGTPDPGVLRVVRGCPEKAGCVFLCPQHSVNPDHGCTNLAEQGGWLAPIFP